LGALLVFALTLGVIGCGGDSGSTGGNGGGSGSVSPEAKSAVDAHTKNPTKIGPSKPVGKPIPTGKKIFVLSCGQPGCNDAVASFHEAAKVLGWSVDEATPPQPTPQLIQQVVDQGLAKNPDAVVVSSTVLSNFKRQAAEMEQKKIPLVTLFGTEPAGGPITAAVASAQISTALARLAADKIAVDLGGKGTIGTVGLQGFGGSVPIYIKAFKDEAAKVCPDCKVKETQVNPADIGSTSGKNIANFLRANPDVKAVMLGFDGLGADLKAAGAAAGIKLPPTYSIITTAGGIPELQNGTRTATVPADFAVAGWAAADALARVFTGKPEDAQTESPKPAEPVIWSKEYGNVPTLPPDTKFLPALVKDYQSQFKKLWGK